MVPRGLCIRRKDRNRKQSRSKYIRVGNPRQSIYLPKAERTPVCICICHQSAPAPLLLPLYQHLGWTS
ncbi:hypothetical protein V8E51_000662 [Hyaloscypha variabilis]